MAKNACQMPGLSGDNILCAVLALVKACQGTVQLNEHCGEVTEISPGGIPRKSPEPLLHALCETFGTLRNTRSDSKPPAPPGTDAATLGTRNIPLASFEDKAMATLATFATRHGAPFFTCSIGLPA